MSSSEIIFNNATAGDAYRHARTISVSASHGKTTVINFEIAVTSLDDEKVEGDESQKGQWLLWLLAVSYLALVFALYYGAYFALKALTSLTGAPGS